MNAIFYFSTSEGVKATVYHSNACLR